MPKSRRQSNKRGFCLILFLAAGLSLGQATAWGQSVQVEIDVNTPTAPEDLASNQIGERFYYAINTALDRNPDQDADPNDHNILVNGAVIGGDSNVETVLTFGANSGGQKGAVNVTDSLGETPFGGIIDGSGSKTTINVVGKSIFNLGNTRVENGTTIFNINNSEALATIGGQKDSSIIASTSTGNGATLFNKGNVVGVSSIHKGETSSGAINYQIDGIIGGDGDISTNFTITDVFVTAVDINGGTAGTTIKIESGAGFHQDESGLISGKVTLYSETNNDTRLGFLQNNASLTFNSDTGTGEVSLSGTGNGASASINNQDGTLKVLGTGDNSNTTYMGSGNTFIYGTGNNSTTTVEDNGQVTLADDGTSSIGSNSALAVNNGQAVLAAGVDSDFLTNLQTIRMNSSQGTSTLDNQTDLSLSLNSGLTVVIGNHDVIVKTGEGLSLDKDISLSGNGSGSLLVAGTGFLRLNALNTAADGGKIAFDANQGYLNAQTANVNGPTIYDANLVISNSGSTDNTIYADTLNLNSTLRVGNDFSLAGGAGLSFSASANYADGGTAITVAGNASIAPGTLFNLSNQNRSAYFRVLDGDAIDQQDWANLAYVNGNGLDNNGNAHLYDRNSGYFCFIMGQDMGQSQNAALLTINPLQTVMQNLDKPFGSGQATRIWSAPAYAVRTINGNPAAQYSRVEIKNYSLSLGADQLFQNRYLLGGFAAVNQARLNANLSQINSNGFNLGLYARLLFGPELELDLGLAHGWQNYEAKRQVALNGPNPAKQHLSADFHGRSLALSAELGKRFDLGHNFSLRPGLGYTYLGTWLNAYTEQSSLDQSQVWNLAQQVEASAYHQHLARIGADLTWAANSTAITGKFYYLRRFGDKQPVATARLVNAQSDDPSFRIVGATEDANLFNLGLAVEFAPLGSAKVSLSYDALLGAHSHGHSLNLAINYRW